MTEKSKIFVFLDGEPELGAQLFEHPIDIITTSDPQKVSHCLKQIQNESKKGRYLAGFMSYECGYVLEDKLHDNFPARIDSPLLWFGVFETAHTIPFQDIETWLATQENGAHNIGTISPSLSQAAYEEKFNKVKDYISAGDIYQANLTFKGHFDFNGCPISLYRKLRRGQQTALGGLIETGDETFLSLSPELFFSRQGDIFSCRPMKGTAKRGITNTKDAAIKKWLQTDEKSQAENLMIVDLMRNDMSRISEPGSVQVKNLFKIETYTTLHQMTSDITSQLVKGTSISEIMSNIFPCGSVTGAPKVRAMEIIEECEDAPRGIYTGAIGSIAPNGDAQFNVAIRTIKVKENRGEIGIGSGLVADSQLREEYGECLLKMKFLETPQPDFDLLETIKWSKEEGYILLDFHLERLIKSAIYFTYSHDRATIVAALNKITNDFSENDYRVRLTLNSLGEVDITHTELPTQIQEHMWTFAVSDKTINLHDPFFYHKTTHRRFYDDEREKQKIKTGCDEVIFLNNKGEITEGSFTNIFLRIGGTLLTPARECGLLDGTLRRHLLTRDTDRAQEAVLTLEDLEKADEIYLGNSVRGLISAKPATSLEPA